MKSSLLTIAAAIVAAAQVSVAAAAHDYAKGPLKVGDPWSRATVAAQKVGAGYMTIENTGREADRLVGASTAAAERVEMHVTTVENNVAKMREVKGYDLKPGATLKLAPGGAHLMLVNLKQPLKAGDKLPLKLRFERAGELDVELEVQASAPAAKHGH